MEEEDDGHEGRELFLDYEMNFAIRRVISPSDTRYGTMDSEGAVPFHSGLYLLSVNTLIARLESLSGSLGWNGVKRAGSMTYRQ